MQLLFIDEKLRAAPGSHGEDREMKSLTPQEYATFVRGAPEFTFPPVVPRTEIADELPRANPFNLVRIMKVAMRATRVSEGTVITLREEGVVETEEGRIEIVPAWKWMLLGKR